MLREWLPPAAAESAFAAFRAWPSVPASRQQPFSNQLPNYSRQRQTVSGSRTAFGAAPLQLSSADTPRSSWLPVAQVYIYISTSLSLYIYV